MIENAKFSEYCFYINTNVQRDFQICISVPLTRLLLGYLNTRNTSKTNTDYVKSVRIRSWSGLDFPTFGLNTKRQGLFLRIQSECGKIQTRITPNTDTFTQRHLLKFSKDLKDSLVLKKLKETEENLKETEVSRTELCMNVFTVIINIFLYSYFKMIF